MIRHLLGIPVLILVVIIGLSLYLQPDDLKGCNNTITSQAPCTRVDAIVAISGGDTDARTDEAVKLYKGGWSDILIFSGAAVDKSGPSNAAAMKARALAAGVPSIAIYIDEYSTTTKENAEKTKTILTSQRAKNIILVTSGYHQRRAYVEFSKQLTDIAVLSHPVASDKDWSWWWWVSPSGWILAVGEFIKIFATNFGIS